MRRSLRVNASEPRRPVQSFAVSGDPLASAAAQPAPRTLSPTLRWGAALLFAVVISDARSLTLPASLLVLAGGLGIWWSARYAPPVLLPSASAPVAGVAAWAIAFGAFAVWELGAFVIGNNDAHPTFSMLSDPVLSFGPTRALCAFGWLAGGWYLLRRRPTG
jgi:hypothetical protein